MKGLQIPFQSTRFQSHNILLKYFLAFYKHHQGSYLYPLEIYQTVYELITSIY